MRVTLVLYIRASLWSGEMKVEDLDLRSEPLGDWDWLVTQPEDLVLVREIGRFSSTEDELECKKLRCLIFDSISFT